MFAFYSVFLWRNGQNCVFLHHEKSLDMMNFNLNTHLSWRTIALRVAFVVVTVTLIVWLMPRDTQLNFKVELNKPWNYPDVIAAFDFFVPKSEAAIEREREQALSEFIPYYEMDESVFEQQQRLFLQRYRDSLPRLGRDYRVIITNQLRSIYDQGIIDSHDPLVATGDTSLWFRRVKGNAFVYKRTSDVFTPSEAYRRLSQSPFLRSHQEELLYLGLNDFLVPNLFYDSVRNTRERNELLRGVDVPEDSVQRGEKIINKGDIVDEHKYQVLTTYQAESKQYQDTRKERNTIIGEALYVLILVVGFTCYLGIYRKDYFERIRTICMLYALIVIFAVLAALLVGHNMLHVYILPFAIVPIFIRVFMDSRTAFMAHVVVVLMVACMLQHPLEFVAVQLTAGIAAVFSLRELSSRSQLFWTAALWTFTATVTHLSLYLIRNNDITTFDVSELYYLLMCGIIVFCAYPLLYVIEKAFGFVSDITLVELSNTSKELLRRLSEEAPGTFNHSIQVGNLGAEVARRIDANAQLVRTGALYHDIGKMQNPIYFTENQSGGISPHDSLSYIESAQIIIGHVTEGLRLADKYHLPRKIRDLIATHHGQGKAKYFFIKYKNEHPDEPVDDLLFTYPGPNPFTKEQAILMMADSVEAASRSLPDYTEQTIRNLVERIIDSMVAEGYFRECPITFRDIQYTKTVLIEKLKTIYHTRISYPEEKK